VPIGPDGYYGSSDWESMWRRPQSAAQSPLLDCAVDPERVGAASRLYSERGRAGFGRLTLVGNSGPRRRTASDYEAFFTGLCGMPPSPERDKCLRCLTTQLVGLYANLGVTPPPGLVEFSERIGR